MRIARYWPHAALLILGAAIGATATVVLRAPGGPGAAPTGGSSAELAAKLLPRIAPEIVGDSRADPGGDSLLLYATPKEFGETLCRVDVYAVAPRIERGHPLDDKEAWDDPLEVETKYGLWKGPHAPGGDRAKACKAFRDFKHLIAEGSVLSVARGTYVMDTILGQAKAGRFAFKVSCTIFSALGDKSACDALTVLRALSLSDIKRTEKSNEVEGEHSAVRTDLITLDYDPVRAALKRVKSGSLTIRVRDEQHYGKQSIDEADILSIEIEIGEEC